jgi:CHAT domain-containing protein/tetratricopeptide (TPR) repeat protein
MSMLQSPVVMALFCAVLLAGASPSGSGQPAEGFAEIVRLEALAGDAQREGRFAVTEAAHGRALQIAATLGRPRLTAALLNRLGQFYEDNNRIQRGLIAYEEGIKALEKDPSLDLSRAVERLQGGRKDTSAEPVVVPADLYRESVAGDLEVEERDPLLAVKLLVNVGNGYFRQAQLSAALRAYEAALARPEIEGAPQMRGFALANLGEILRRQGRPDEARRALQEARALIEQHGQPGDERRVLTSLARMSAERGEVEDARALYIRAVELYRKARDPRGEARAFLGLGYLELSQGRMSAARAAYERGLQLGEALNDQDVLWPALWGLGRCQRAAGELNRAAQSYARSIEIIGYREGELTTDEGKVALVQTARDAFDELIAVHLERAPANATAFADALGVAEQSRARALNQLMRGWGDARPSLASLGLAFCYRPPPTAAELECDDGNVPGLPSAIANQFVGATPTVGPRRECRPARSGPSMAVQMQIGTPVPQFEDDGVAAAPRPQKSPAQPAPLPRLVFHVMRDRTAVFAVDPAGGVRGFVAPIGEAVLAERVHDLRAALAVDQVPRGVKRAGTEEAARAAPALDLEAALGALYRDLIAPLERALPAAGSVLVIEPHGPLWLLPFAALPAQAGGWLGQRYRLVHAPSAATLDEVRATLRPTEHSASRILVIGNPIVAQVADASDDPFRSRLQPLPGAEQEAKRITALFPSEQSTLLIGAHATLEALEKAARGHQVIHLATHGFASAERPLESYLVLAPSVCEDRLSARRAMALPLSADLVTLSACQTGLGRISGEGVMGLSRAFFVAGARSVLVSLWSVSDEATERLMTAFYRHYVNGMSKAAALQEAMREVRALPSFSNPRYWAPFILLGAES